MMPGNEETPFQSWLKGRKTQAGPDQTRMDGQHPAVNVADG